MVNISPQHFTEGPLRQIFNLYCECYQSGQEVDFNRIMVATEDPPTKSMLAELAESVDAKTKLDLGQGAGPRPNDEKVILNKIEGA